MGIPFTSIEVGLFRMFLLWLVAIALWKTVDVLMTFVATIPCCSVSQGPHSTINAHESWVPDLSLMWSRTCSVRKIRNFRNWPFANLANLENLTSSLFSIAIKFNNFFERTSSDLCWRYKIFCWSSIFRSYTHSVKKYYRNMRSHHTLCEQSIRGSDQSTDRSVNGTGNTKAKHEARRAKSFISI